MRQICKICGIACGDVRRYANFRICGIISAYAILKTQFICAEKYAIYGVQGSVTMYETCKCPEVMADATSCLKSNMAAK